MIVLAPLQGFTDFVFRNVYNRYYTGIDIAVSPIIPLTQGKNGITRIAKDVLPANNHTMPVIPQLFGNKPELFIPMAKVFDEWGYNQLNWNIGCPVKNSTRKKRGSGLLPYPELVREILEKIIPNISQQLSIKLRLGLNSTDEIYKLIPVLNDFPLENITVHPRTAAQMYEGGIHHDVLTNCLPLFKHEIIYNGDIITFADFEEIKQKYPTIKKWMIGRGVFYNPLLPAIVKGEQLLSKEKDNELLLSFLLDLYKELQLYKTHDQVVRRIKDLWTLISKRFVNSENIFVQISHSYSIDEIINLTRKIIAEEGVKDSF
jgi:tRNA-dihydrouridine synthase B